jgi:RNA recognition motif-containing protein
LIFDINEKLLRKLFNKFGTISEVNIPRDSASNKSKGYAFVNFENYFDAAKAIKELNET